VPQTDRETGYFRGGLPYNRLGSESRPLVVFPGLVFEHKPQPRMTIQSYRFLGEDYQVYVVLRKPGPPPGYTFQDMANDYAAMIGEEFDGPVDVIGVSTGGSIALNFAADHPELLRRLVVHSSAYTLSEAAKQLQLRMGELAQQRQWAQVSAVLLSTMFPRSGTLKTLSRPLVWLLAQLMSLSAPDDPRDLVVTIEAENQFNFKEGLAQISAPTLVVAGTEDFFYTPDLVGETAAGIPDARLILYEGMGHPASGKEFSRDVLAFLREER